MTDAVGVAIGAGLSSVAIAWVEAFLLHNPKRGVFWFGAAWGCLMVALIGVVL